MKNDKDEDLIVDEVAEETEAPVVYDIATYPSDLTLSVLYEMWKNGDIKIPEYQRNYVWNIKQASLLIESFLLGLPIPQVFFHVDENNKNLVIDGQQRLLSIIYYFNGYFGDEDIRGKKQTFRLQGLDEKNPFYNKGYNDLDESLKRRFKSCILRVINIRQLHPKDESTSVYHIFERLNTGGTPLKPQEIRNCVFLGGLVKILGSLNKDPNWRKILGKKNLDKHQKDVELVLRVFALSGNWEKYQKPMKEYLNNAMRKERGGDSQRVQKFKNNFKKISKYIYQNLGEKPFRIRGPLNTAILDSTFCVLMENSEKLPKDLDKRFKKLFKNKEYIDSTLSATTDVLVLKKRFEKAKEILIRK